VRIFPTAAGSSVVAIAHACGRPAPFAQANTSTPNGYYMRSDHDLARVDGVEREAAPQTLNLPEARGELGA
jgi:hypothetical protein